MLPAELPEELIKKPTVYLRDLRPGEHAWINWNDMEVDKDRRCFLNPDAKVVAETGISIRATRTEEGFEVWIPATKVPLLWTPRALSVGASYFPVLKLERAAESGDQND